MSPPPPSREERTRCHIKSSHEQSANEGQGSNGQHKGGGEARRRSEKGNLYVRDLNSDRRIPLTKNVPDGPVSNSRAVWSPDGKRIALVQSDESQVSLPVCASDHPALQDPPEARQLMHSLLRYIDSPAFMPRAQLDAGLLKKLLPGELQARP